MSRLKNRLAPDFLTVQLQPADFDLEACSAADVQRLLGGIAQAARVLVEAIRDRPVVHAIHEGVGHIRARGGLLHRTTPRKTDVLNPDARTNVIPTINIEKLATAAELAIARETIISSRLATESTNLYHGKENK